MEGPKKMVNLEQIKSARLVNNALPQGKPASIRRASEEDLEDFHIIFYALIVMMIVLQIVLFLWKTRHVKSFHLVSLVALWGIPGFASISLGFWRFVFVWSVFSVSCLAVVRLALKTPVAPTTPRFVYRYFLFTYRISMFIFALGILFSILLFLLIGNLEAIVSGPLLLTFYGLYFGVLGRDMAETCAERMATNIGYYYKKGQLAEKHLDSNTCALCAQSFGNRDVQIETTFTLQCGHEFHNHCLRGWTMLGRKNMCPYCSTRVSLDTIETNFWNRHSANWGQVLDTMRYLVVWNPLLAVCTQGLVMLLSSHHSHSHV